VTTPAPGITGPLTPYVVPGDALTGWPVGVDFSTIPMGTTVTTGQKTAALYNMCQSSTQQVDEYCNQPLRATVSTEEQSGPDYYVTVQVGSGLGRMILQRWPITQIIAVNVAASAGFPTQWTAVPAGYWRIERPVQGLYGTNAPSGAGEGGQAVLIAPAYINWLNGRNGLRVQVQYMHGWPHAGLTAAGSASTSSLVVDDCTGWGSPGTNSAANSTFGATGVIYDGASQETIQCTAASATAGPGTLTLSSPLTYTHAAGVMVSALPANVIWSSALFTGADALTRGATTTVVRNISGHAGGPSGADELRIDAEMKLRPYRATV
jgi:hypothetical protein